MNDLLEKTRRTFGRAPRTFPLWERWTYLNTPRPIWCTSQDDLSHFFQAKWKLLEEGVVVWGHIVQANRLLFEPGRINCPAEAVFSLGQEFDEMVPYLGAVAHSLYELKGTSPPQSALNRIAAHLANERTRVYGLEVPSALSPVTRCMLSTIFVDRNHLPARQLLTSWFPLVVNPRPPHYAMILPERYWSPLLKVMWR